ncbi:MAG TPA: hypothetical protein VJ810_22230 [Blastocatellia bacterium]|nr:hypothetical protein [Blastocatellia bacterium]
MMKHGFIALSFILLLTSSADSRPDNRAGDRLSPGQKQGAGEKVLTAEDFARDYGDNRIDRGSGREEVSFLIEINPRLPPYRFRLIPDPSALANCDDPSSAGRCPEEHPRVGRIEISTNGSPTILQTIEVASDAWASMFTQHFQAKDINFDGYLDIATLDGYGAKWSGFNYWLFDKRSGRFIANLLTSELRKLTFNEMTLYPETKEIHTTHLPSVCFGKKIHKIVNGRLVLMYSEEPRLEGEGEDFCKVRIEKRINGVMKPIN